jgi:hypothetical protein
MTVAQRPIEAHARLRAKNQLTLPEPIAEALGAASARCLTMCPDNVSDRTRVIL